MAPRQRVPVPLGAGLDRATGAGAVDGRTLAVGRNLYAREAALALRPGLIGSGLTAYDAAEATNKASDILCTTGMQSTKDLLQVTYDRTTRKIIVWRINPNGPAKQFVTLWGTLDASASFPVITAAESYGKIFFAHAEPLLAYRFSTGYYTPNALDATVGSWTTLTADLNNDATAADIKFYTVASWGGYLAGAGWGTETDTASQDRPETVRLSVGADPTVFRPETYFLCGPRGERVENLLAMPDGLIVNGARQSHTIFGTSPADFGVRLVDPTFGCTAARAGLVVGDTGYQWSAQGPRRRTSALAASEDVAIPLEVFEAQPTGTTASGPDRLRFAAYDPVSRLLYFMAPDTADQTTTFGYVGSLRNPAALRFTDCVLQRVVLCAGPYFTGKVTPPPGTGYAASLAAVDDGWIVATSGRRLSLSWTNTSALGNESVEVWLKTGATWAIAQVLTLSGSTQSTTITGLEALTDYEVAVRFRTPIGGYTTGYTEATPDLWSAGTAAGARDTIATGATTPTLTASDWTRTSSTTTVINLAGVIVDRRVDLVIEKNVASGGWVTAATVTPASTSWTYAYAILTGEVDLSIQFRVRHVRSALSSSYSATRTRVAGFNPTNAFLDTPYDVTSGEGRTKASIRFLFTNPTNLDAENLQATHFQIQEIGGSNTTMSAPPSNLVYGWTPVIESTILTGTSGSMNCRYRWGRLAYGVTDWGPWSGNGFPVTVSGATAPPAPDPAYWSGPDGTLDVATAFPVDFLALISDSQPEYAWLVIIQDNTFSDSKVAVRGYPADPNWGQPITITAPTEHAANGQPRLVLSAYEQYDAPGSALILLSAKMVNP